MGGRRIAILTSGGDAPGMNAAVRAATLVALAQGVEVFGVLRGYQGLLAGELAPLHSADVLGVLREGGTFLGSARSREFHARDARDRARAILRDQGIEGVIVIGGNGSLAGALALSNAAECAAEPVRVVAIPASIDNDVGLTGMCIGVDTAMNTIVDAVDKIADTATAHSRTFIVEVMGRDCGYLAMTSAIASGADTVLFPEAHHSEEQIVERLAAAVIAAHGRGHRNRRVICVKAEGVPIPAERLKALVDARLEQELGELTSETRVTVLGHVVRGGRPSAFDRLLASRLAHVAVRALLAGATRKMASWMPPAELPEEFGERSDVDPYCWLVELEAAIAESDEMLTGDSPLVRWRAGVFDELESVFLL